MNANLFIASSLVLVLLGLLAYTIWYRMHKRKMRKCKDILPSGRVCGCDPDRIGQVYQMSQSPGTDSLSDGIKVLAVVLTRCRITGEVKIAKHEQKYIRPISRRWKMLMEPAAYQPNIGLLLSVKNPMEVVQMLELIKLSNGRDGTTLLEGDLREPSAVPFHILGLREVIERRRRARQDKFATGPLRSLKPPQGIPA